MGKAASPWNNGDTCQFELGWKLSVSDRVALDVALTRYRLWTLQDSLAGHIFRSSHFSAAPNWALLSLKFLSEKQLLDWPIWMSQSPRGTYKHYLEEALSRPVCFDLKEGLALHLPWDVVLCRRAVLQLRRGYISLGHLNGKKSKAQVQQCIFCGRRYSHVKLHVLCACTCFKDSANPVQRIFLLALTCPFWTFLQVILVIGQWPYLPRKLWGRRSTSGKSKTAAGEMELWGPCCGKLSAGFISGSLFFHSWMLLPAWTPKFVLVTLNQPTNQYYGNNSISIKEYRETIQLTTEMLDVLEIRCSFHMFDVMNYFTLPETNIARESLGLEDEFPFGKASWQVLCSFWGL